MVAAGRRIALAACAAFAVLGPGAAGAQPPVTALDEIFSPDKGGVPYPFEALVKALEDRIAPARLRTALVPIGRSLQRFGADPDYFGSPRIVIAVDSDPADGPALKDRLFVGYQPAAGIVEAISYSAASGRFEFRTVEDYGSGKPDLFTPAERDICMRCHQGGAPIFSTPLWGETNGNAAIAARLKPLGTTFHGVPVVQGIDGPDAFDQAVERANGLMAASWLWQAACPDGDAGGACRADLLGAVLRFRLGGDRATSTDAALAASLSAALGSAEPEGFALADFRIPSRDPSLQLDAGAAPGDIVQAEGVFDPETPRARRVLFETAGDAAAIADAAIRTLAPLTTDADIALLDRHLSAASGETRRFESACLSKTVARGGDRSEIRFTCATNPAFSISGFVVTAGGAVSEGRIDTLAVAGETPLNRLKIDPDRSAIDGRTLTLALVQANGLGARLSSGDRLSPLELALDEPWDATMARIAIHDDGARLSAALAGLAERPDSVLAHGPFRRRAIMSAIIAALAGGT
ncbi:MAG: hypothetical protein KDJ77_04445 [Rhodobiaceae bacterium]|nr:hypothetical protein [Rhodobiaceae bacterium]